MRADAACQVIPFSISALKGILAEKAGIQIHVIDSKDHGPYLDVYLQKIGAMTIVVENNYVDRDYLEDFASYYVRCFPPYGRKCTRLHFFSHKFTKAQLLKVLCGRKTRITEELLQQTYLGFMVAKPLPQTVIGRTCLKPYGSDRGRRWFPVVRPYTANLFGLRLRVESLAYQEQDTVVAACATSALWSVFHATGMEFQHSIPSPVEITRSSTVGIAPDSRVFPNSGLTVNQMAQAIRNVGLEPYALRVKNQDILKNTAYAYIRGKIPLLLTMSIWEENRSTYLYKVEHAVAITGFSLPPNQQRVGGAGFRLHSDCIDKIYVHDDQGGPFARMEFDGRIVTGDIDGCMEQNTSLSLTYGEGKLRAVPDYLVIPVYHKIRIPYGRVHAITLAFDSVVEAVRSGFDSGLSERIEWDIYLITVEDLKFDIFNSAISGNLKKEILLSEMPKYLWRATGYCAHAAVLELIFDATDIEQGSIFVRAVELDGTFSAVMREMLKTPKFRALFDHPESQMIRGIISWFIEQPPPQL